MVRSLQLTTWDMEDQKWFTYEGFEAIKVSKCNDIFSGDSSRQDGMDSQHFGDCHCLHYQRLVWWMAQIITLVSNDGNGDIFQSIGNPFHLGIAQNFHWIWAFNKYVVIMYNHRRQELECCNCFVRTFGNIIFQQVCKKLNPEYKHLLTKYGTNICHHILTKGAVTLKSCEIWIWRRENFTYNSVILKHYCRFIVYLSAVVLYIFAVYQKKRQWKPTFEDFIEE